MERIHRLGLLCFLLSASTACGPSSRAGTGDGKGGIRNDGEQARAHALILDGETVPSDAYSSSASGPSSVEDSLVMIVSPQTAVSCSAPYEISCDDVQAMVFFPRDDLEDGTTLDLHAWGTLWFSNGADPCGWGHETMVGNMTIVSVEETTVAAELEGAAGFTGQSGVPLDGPVEALRCVDAP